ncbi:MAG: hypothetical protein AB7U82_13535 [Blastocatellales bacterium]
MSRRALLLIVILFVVSISASCSLQQAGEAIQETEKFLEEFSMPTAEDKQNHWGMTDIQVFGHGLMGIGAGGVSYDKLADSPLTYEVTMPFWCEGKTFQGDPIKLSRKLHVKLARAEEGEPWQVQTYELRGAEPLSFGWQLLVYLWDILWVSGLVFLFFRLWSSRETALGITRLAWIPIVGYVGFICFGSIAAAFICIVAHFIIVALLMGVAAASAS